MTLKLILNSFACNHGPPNDAASYTVALHYSSSLDGDHGARIPFPGFPPRKLAAPEVHRETAGDASRGRQRKAGQRKRQRQTSEPVQI